MVVIGLIRQVQENNVPQNISTRETGVYISAITSTSDSNKLVVSPRRRINYSSRVDHDKGESAVIEASTIKKRKTKDDESDNGRSGKYTMTETRNTTGTNSQTETSIYDLENGDDSKQNHDAQKKLEGPRFC